MALIALEGFDHLSTAAELAAKRLRNVYGTPSIGSGYGRFSGSNGLLSQSSNYFSIVLPSSYTTIYTGFAIYRNGSQAPNGGDGDFIVMFGGSSTGVRVIVAPDYYLKAYNNSYPDVLLGTSTNMFTNYAWHYIEVYLKIHSSSGEITVKMDGEVEIEEVSLNTIDTYGPSSCTYLTFKRPDDGFGGQAAWFDDIYIDSSQFRGEMRIKTFFPDADGTHSDLTPSTPGSHYAMVDEADPDDDTTYLSGSTTGQKESLGITTSGLSGTILGIQVCQISRKTAEAYCGIKNLVRVGGSDYLGSTEHSLPQTFATKHDIWEDNPNTSNPWTPSELDSAEFGTQIVNLSSTTTT